MIILHNSTLEQRHNILNRNIHSRLMSEQILKLGLKFSLSGNQFRSEHVKSYEWKNKHITSSFKFTLVTFVIPRVS